MPTHHRRAFTLIELLTVIAIIGVLASLFLGGMSRVKSKGHRTTCLNNQRQLLLTWKQFALETDSRLPLNHRSSGATNQTPVPWVSGDGHYTYYTVTNPAMVTDPVYSSFASAKLPPKVFRCPSIRHKVAGQEVIRNYAMNHFMGPGAFAPGAGYATYSRFEDISNPAERFVFTEVNPQNMCHTFLWVSITQTNADGSIAGGDFHHLPAYPHDRTTMLAYADGHVEQAKLLDPDTLRTWQVDWISDHGNLNIPTNADFVWFANHMTTPK